MQQLFSLVLLAFFFTSALIVPFIDLLYKLKFKRTLERSKWLKGGIFEKLHDKKVGTPVGGGFLVIVVTLGLSVFLVPIYSTESPLKLLVLAISMFGFGLLGLYDDIHKFFKFKQQGVWGLPMRWKFVIQWLIGIVIGSILHYGLYYNNIYIPLIGNFQLGFAYIFFAAFVIVSFCNAFNITDGLDGLAGGLLIICLLAFLVVASTATQAYPVVDETLQIFLGVWLGAMFAFLYFNIYPARIWMGDVGALAFGATLGTVALLTAKVFPMALVGGAFIFEVFTSLTQLLSLHYRKKRVWPIAPFHLFLQYRGWDEPTIVMRFWLIGGVFAVFGVWVALLI